MGSKKVNYYQLLIQLSGIPPEIAEKELAPYFKSLGEDPHHMSLESLRKILALYLQDMDQSMVEEENTKVAYE